MAKGISSLRKPAINPSLDTLKAADSGDSPSVPVMIGTYFHAMDDKGRVIIPAKLRPALTERFWMMLDENNNIAIQNYQTGLDIFAHCETMMAENPGDDVLVAAVERITSAADLLTVENDNWRVPVSEMLRYYAGLEKDVVTVGVLNYAVLWDREKWEAAQLNRAEELTVRKAQAGILRVAASGGGARANGIKQHDATKTSEDASASDGEGSAKRSRLSQLGR